jgi:hypothetical protein
MSYDYSMWGKTERHLGSAQNAYSHFIAQVFGDLPNECDLVGNSDDGEGGERSAVVSTMNRARLPLARVPKSPIPCM